MGYTPLNPQCHKCTGTQKDTHDVCCNSVFADDAGTQKDTRVSPAHYVTSPIVGTQKDTHILLERLLSTSIVGTQKDTHVSHLFVVYALNFEATGARVPFAALRERNPDKEAEELERYELIYSMKSEGMSYSQIAEALGYKSKTSVMKLLREEE